MDGFVFPRHLQKAGNKENGTGKTVFGSVKWTIEHTSIPAGNESKLEGRSNCATVAESPKRLFAEASEAIVPVINDDHLSYPFGRALGPLEYRFCTSSHQPLLLAIVAIAFSSFSIPFFCFFYLGKSKTITSRLSPTRFSWTPCFSPNAGEIKHFFQPRLDTCSIASRTLPLPTPLTATSS